LWYSRSVDGEQPEKPKREVFSDDDPAYKKLTPEDRLASTVPLAPRRDMKRRYRRPVGETRWGQEKRGIRKKVLIQKMADGYSYGEATQKAGLVQTGNSPVADGVMDTTRFLEQFMARRRTVSEALHRNGVTEDAVAVCIKEGMDATRPLIVKGERGDDVPDYKVRLTAAKLAADALQMTGSSAHLDLRIQQHTLSVQDTRKALDVAFREREEAVKGSLRSLTGGLEPEKLALMTTKEQARWFLDAQRHTRGEIEKPDWRDYVYLDRHPEGRLRHTSKYRHEPLARERDDRDLLRTGRSFGDMYDAASAAGVIKTLSDEDEEEDE
jgi:hypothetical protein